MKTLYEIPKAYKVISALLVLSATILTAKLL
jgi:hypothetical protein